MRSSRNVRQSIRQLIAALFLWAALSISMPALAQMTVTAPDVDAAVNAFGLATAAEWVKDAAQWYQQNVQASVAAVTAAIAQWLRANLEVKITDIKSANDRQNVNAAATASMVDKYVPPATDSSCYKAQSSAAADEASSVSAAIGGAMTIGGMKRPNTLAMTNKETQAKIADGLVACSTAGDSDTSSYKAMNCTPKFGGAFEGADLTSDALFGSYGKEAGSPYELPVPPNLQPFTAGVYQPVPVVTDEKYMPFIAAYSYCQRLNPVRSQLATQTSGNATIEVLSAPAKNDADAAQTTAYTMCMNILKERMQYGSEDSSYALAFNAQKTLCAADSAKHWFGDGPSTTSGNSSAIQGSTLSKCNTMGRSDLQAWHDNAYRDMYKDYQVTYISGGLFTQDAKGILESNLVREKNDFASYILMERQALITAKAAADAARPFNTNAAMAQPVLK